MSKETKIERIRLDLEGIEAKKLRYVKKRLGIKANTELIRILITKAFHEQGGKEGML